jgi:long-chain acyl-CoA synthetase
MPPPIPPPGAEEEIAKLVGPGGQFELGMDKWPCGGGMATGLCFVKGPRTLKDLYEMCFSDPSVADRDFLVYESERYSFDEVFSLVRACAAGLAQQLGVQVGDRVGLCMRNLPEWVITFLAVTYAGAVVVPLNGWYVPMAALAI